MKIVLVTERKEYLYQVFSTYNIVLEDYYIDTEFETNESYYEFLKKIKRRSNKDYKLDVNPTDTILTLSSCISGGKKRVVFHAKKIW